MVVGSLQFIMALWIGLVMLIIALKVNWERVALAEGLSHGVNEYILIKTQTQLKIFCSFQDKQQVGREELRAQ